MGGVEGCSDQDRSAEISLDQGGGHGGASRQRMEAAGAVGQVGGTGSLQAGSMKLQSTKEMR